MKIKVKCKEVIKIDYNEFVKLYSYVQSIKDHYYLYSFASDNNELKDSIINTQFKFISDAERILDEHAYAYFYKKANKKI